MSKDTCPCGGIIFADSDDWDVPLCYDCFPHSMEKELARKTEQVDIYEAALENLSPLKVAIHMKNGTEIIAEALAKGRALESEL